MNLSYTSDPNPFDLSHSTTSSTVHSEGGVDFLASVSGADGPTEPFPAEDTLFCWDGCREWWRVPAVRAGDGRAAGTSRVTLGVGVARTAGSGEVEIGILCTPIGTTGTGARMLVASGVAGGERNLGERLSLSIGERVDLGGEPVDRNEV